MKYSDDLSAMRQIKFLILCGYEVKTSEMKIQALSEDLSQIQWYTFSQKWEKMPDLGFGTSYKDGLCPKLENKSYKAKIRPTKSFI